MGRKPEKRVQFSEKNIRADNIILFKIQNVSEIIDVD